MCSWTLNHGGAVCKKIDLGSLVSWNLDIQNPVTLARIYKAVGKQKDGIVLVKDLTYARSILPSEYVAHFRVSRCSHRDPPFLVQRVPRLVQTGSRRIKVDMIVVSYSPKAVVAVQEEKEEEVEEEDVVVEAWASNPAFLLVCL